MRNLKLVLLGCLGVFGCSPDDESDPPNVPSASFSGFLGSRIVIDHSFPDRTAEFFASGEVSFHKDLELDDTTVTLLADGAPIASQDCTAEFRNTPNEGTGRKFDIRCNFVASKVGALCDASDTGIQILVRSNGGNYDSPIEDLEVACLEDRREPGALDLTSEGNPDGKPCSETDGDLEYRFGFADGRVLFQDEYEQGEFIERAVYARNQDGTVSQVVTVDKDGLWLTRKTYVYVGGVVTTRTQVAPSGEPHVCSYAFTNDDRDWLTTCPGQRSTATWDKAARMLKTEGADGLDHTLTYSGELGSPTQFITEHRADSYNSMRPIKDEALTAGYPFLTTYSYGDGDLLTGITTSLRADSRFTKTVRVIYSCP